MTTSQQSWCLWKSVPTLIHLFEKCTHKAVWRDEGFSFTEASCTSSITVWLLKLPRYINVDLWGCCLGFSCKEILFPLHNISSCGSFKIRDHCSGVFLLVLYRCGNNTFPGIRWTVGWESQKIRQLLKVVTFCLCRHPLSFVCLWALPLSFEHDYWISLSCF